jgi:hypothetical protein
MQENLENLKVGQLKPPEFDGREASKLDPRPVRDPNGRWPRGFKQKSPISSRSKTPNSASTYEYSHEPLLSFQHKIFELAGQIGASAITNGTRLCGDESNRVISAILGVSNESALQVKGVFCIPCLTIFEDDEKAAIEPYEVDRAIHEHVVLSVLAAVREVPSAAILAFDATTANAIHSPYTFQEFAGGTRLDELYDKISPDEKLNTVD